MNQITIYYPTIKESFINSKKIYYYDLFFGKMRNFSCDKLNYKYSEVSYVEKDSKKIELNELTEEELEIVKNKNLIKKANVMVAIPVIETQYRKVHSKPKLDFLLQNYREDIKISEIHLDKNSVTINFEEGNFEDFTEYLDRNLILWN